jgi:hypothetical protein
VETKISGSSAAKPPEGPPMILSKETLADLNYIEPKRSRDRVVSALNELFLRVVSIERMHGPDHKKK